jgi:hypothetical protein
MKVIIFLSSFIFSQTIWAKSEHTCTYKGFDLKVTANKEDNLTVDIFKEKIKISGCTFKVVSYDSGKKGVSTDELIRFEKINCNIIYDKLAKNISVNEKGFLKIPASDKKSYAYIIKNEQPLICGH